MRKLLMVVFLAGFVAAVPALAGQQKTLPQKTSTITGCVAQAGAEYRLDHAIVGTDPDADTQNRPGTEASATPKTMSYTLVGGDLKPHLGHKVEVTGTISSDKTSKVGDMKGAPGMKLAGALNVKSVKMVSASCP